jgi:hypothetical protein
MIDFIEFPKIARLSRPCIVTEKLDGTNAQVHIRPLAGSSLEFGLDTQVEIEGVPHLIRAGSRNRWISTTDDNFGFAQWVYQNAHELAQLGPGQHFGEWWGAGIQRRYGLTEKRFSLFNVTRWGESRPACCHVVPELWRGNFSDLNISDILWSLEACGSAAAPGFMDPEGIIIYHAAAGIGFKKTIKKDDEQKGKQP